MVLGHSAGSNAGIGGEDTDIILIEILIEELVGLL
jgi:hypothetical protein